MLACLWGSGLPFRVSRTNAIVWSISGPNIPRRLLGSDFSLDFNKPLCLSVMPAVVGLYDT